MTTWVVVTDSGRARVFEATRKLDELYEVRGFVSGSLRSTSSIPRRRGNTGTRYHNMEQARSQKEPGMSTAAHALAEFLLQAFDKGQFADIVLVAVPDFLSELREALDKHLQASVKLSIDRDLTRCTTGELEAYFRNAA